MSYDFRYNKKLPEYSNFSLVLGRVTHQFQETVLLVKAITCALPEWDSVKSKPEELFLAELLKSSVKLKQNEKEFNYEELKAKYILMANSACKEYLCHIAPKINPLGLEENIYFSVKGVDSQIRAIIDVREEGVIRDLKTKTKTEKAKATLQYCVYSMAHKIKYGSYPQIIQDSIIILKKETKCLSQEVTVTERHIEKSINIIRAFEDSVEKGTFAPASPMGWWCSSDCSFVDYCNCNVL